MMAPRSNFHQIIVPNVGGQGLDIVRKNFHIIWIFPPGILISHSYMGLSPPVLRYTGVNCKD